MSQSFLFEISWEVANQVGGIYTVLRSKIGAVQEHWGDRYVLVGPYIPENAYTEFEPEIIDHPKNFIERAIWKLQKQGYEGIYYGRWRTMGNPHVVLLDYHFLLPRLGEIKYYFWKDHFIESSSGDDLLNQVYLFSEYVTLFLLMVEQEKGDAKLLAHFHEWMAGSAIPRLRFLKSQISIIFTTHATLLGRYLAMSSDQFYQHLPYFDWRFEAQKYNILTQVLLERSASHGAHVFTTVSEVTSRECELLLGRKPDLVIPNGINVDRFMAIHEFQNLHKEYKNRIHEFVIGHFFPSYTFDLDKTVYFFSSGRFEYRNKGFDITLEALQRLNRRLIEAKSELTVVMFLITKRPFYSIGPRVLHVRAIMDRLRKNCEIIQQQIGERLFFEIVKGDEKSFLHLDQYVDEYWKIRLKKTLQAWKTSELPCIVTHTLVDREHDEVLQFLRHHQLFNQKEQRVKIVYHPDFISPISPIHQLDYDQFVRGCHLGIFPSLYEPWGYTPLECLARGVPAVTSDSAGVGDYVLHQQGNLQEKGIYVIPRRDTDYFRSVDQLVDNLFQFLQQGRRERIEQRNRAEGFSMEFDWKKLYVHYLNVYKRASSRLV